MISKSWKSAHLVLNLANQNNIHTMSKSTHFIGQQRYLQIIKFLDRSKIDSLIRKEGYDRYTKKFDSYTHLITLLYAVLSRYDSIREVAVALLFNANRLHHLGIDYCVK